MVAKNTLRKFSRAELLELLLEDENDALPRAELDVALRAERHRSRYFALLRSTVFILITVAAAAVLVATLWLPVLKVYGTSMNPTLRDGDIVLSLKSSSLERGDVIAFYYNNQVLAKRITAQAGEWIDIDGDGNVKINGSPLEEPYLTNKALGETDLEYPYQVPESRIFVMGDHRATSVDSRSTAVGMVSSDQIVGKIVWRVWPLTEFGPVR